MTKFLFQVTLAFSIALAIGIGPAGIARTNAQQGVTWDESLPIGEDILSSWFPEITADIYGNVHVVWEATRETSEPNVGDINGGAIMYSTLVDGVWAEPSDIYVKDIYNASRPIIVTDENFAYIVARGLRDGLPSASQIQNLASVYIMRAPLTSDLSNANSWSVPIKLSNDMAYWAQMQALGNGELVAVYNALTEVMVDGQKTTRTVLFSRRSMDSGSTWGHPVRISPLDGRTARSSLVLQRPGDRLVVAWDDGYDNLTGTGEPSGIFTAYSTDRGISWSSPSKLDGDNASTFAGSGQVEQAALAASESLTVLVYRSTERDILLYRTSVDAGASWSAEERIPDAVARPYPGPHNFERLGLAFDASGRLHLTFVGTDDDAEEGISVQAATLENGAWSGPEVIAAPPGFPEYPRIAISGGNQLFMTYFVRDQAFIDEGNYVIWLARGEAGAPPLPPLPTPTEMAGEAVPAVEPTPVIGIVQFPTPPAAPTPVERDTSASKTPQQIVENPVLRALSVTSIVILLGVAIRQIGRHSRFLPF